MDNPSIKPSPPSCFRFQFDLLIWRLHEGFGSSSPLRGWNPVSEVNWGEGARRDFQDCIRGMKDVRCEKGGEGMWEFIGRERDWRIDWFMDGLRDWILWDCLCKDGESKLHAWSICKNAKMQKWSNKCVIPNPNPNCMNVGKEGKGDG